MLLRQAANEFGWSLNYGAIALMWRGGCIIRRYGPGPRPLVQRPLWSNFQQLLLSFCSACDEI